MRKSEWIGSIETVNDITCARGDFIAAARIFDDAEKNISTAIAREEEQWGVDAKVARILRIIRGRASTHSITPWTPSSSEQILQSLERSESMQIRWIGQYVRTIIDGVINSAPERHITEVMNVIEKGVPYRRKSSPIHIQILERAGFEEYCVNDLADFFNTTPVLMSWFLTILERKGWIIRYRKTDVEDDKRKVYIKLTPVWKGLVKKVQSKLS